MKVGLYFGSFNPVHAGHLIIANHILNHTPIQRLWFVISPQNPDKPQSGLLNEYHRLHLVAIATEQDPRIKASDIEFALPRPSYTVTTLAYAKEKFPEHEFSIIMGSDSFQNLPRWKNASVIIRDYDIYMYDRPGFSADNNIGARLHLLKAPLLELSSTHVRELVRAGKSIRYLVPDVVRDEIEKGGYYRTP